MVWFVVVNKMNAVGDTEGRVLSVHKSARAAFRGNREAQPKEPGAYLPTVVHTTPLQPKRGSLFQKCEARDSLLTEAEWQDAWERYAADCHLRGVRP